jgi:hypothetical protein
VYQSRFRTKTHRPISKEELQEPKQEETNKRDTKGPALCHYGTWVEHGMPILFIKKEDDFRDKQRKYQRRKAAGNE